MPIYSEDAEEEHRIEQTFEKLKKLSEKERYELGKKIQECRDMYSPNITMTQHWLTIELDNKKIDKLLEEVIEELEEAANKIVRCGDCGSDLGLFTGQEEIYCPACNKSVPVFPEMISDLIPKDVQKDSLEEY